MIYHYIQGALFVVITLFYFFYLLDYKAAKKWYIYGDALFFYMSSIILPPKWDAPITILMVISFCFFFQGWKHVSITASSLTVALFLSEPATYHTLELIIAIPIFKDRHEMIFAYGGIMSRLISGVILYFCGKILKLTFAKVSMPVKYLTGCLLVQSISVFLIYNVYRSAFTQGPHTIRSLLSTFVIIIINVIVLWIFVQLTNYYNTELANQKRLEQLDAFNYEQSNLVNNITAIRQVRHDLSNTFLSSRASLQEGRIDMALSTINRNLDETNPRLVISNTGNHTIDSVINFKAAEATKHHIRIGVNALLERTPSLNWIDIGVILSTALDNAIAACRINSGESDKRIQINITVRHNIFALSVINPFCNDIIPDGKGLLLSTKNDREEHGFGLGSIKRLVENNAGEMDIAYDDGIFTVSVILPEKQ